MGKKADIPCDEILSEVIIEEGEIVYVLQWEGGGPCTGGG